MKPIIIDTMNDFYLLIDQAMSADCIAIDTEFIWEKTYYPIPALLQLGFSTEECYIIDLTKINDFSQFGKILGNSSVQKILHDANQDLSILIRITETYPINIFDTQKAAGFIGLSSCISLSNLIQSILGIKISKTETRTNWLKRPLTQKQISYALNDVRYLPDLRDEIVQRAHINGHKNWLFEEQKEYDNPVLYKGKDNITRLYKTKGIKQCLPKELLILSHLIDWREQKAKISNLPREHVMTDKALLTIARSKSKKITTMSHSKEYTEKKNKKYGDQINQVITNALNTPPDQWPKQRKSFSEDKTLHARIDFIIACIKGKCIAQGIDPSLIASRLEITEYVKGYNSGQYTHNRLTHGWRNNFIGEMVNRILIGEHSVHLNPTTGLPQINTDK